MRNPPSPTGGARVPGWVVRFHKEYQSKLEAWASQKLGRPVKLGQVYGCGHYGCVYQLPGEPWVLKLTRDPNEGPIWEKIRQYDLDGFARVKAIAKLGRALRHQRKVGPVYVILREDIVPYMGSQTATVLDGAGRRLAISGISDATASKIDTDPDPLYAMRSIRTTTYSLQEYRRHATDYVARKRGREQAAEGALTVAEAALMSEPTGYAVGEALATLARDGIFLRDVHLGNVGWRQHPVIDGDEKDDQGLVIYDPGHTPAEPMDVESINPGLTPKGKKVYADGVLFSKAERATIEKENMIFCGPLPPLFDPPNTSMLYLTKNKASKEELVAVITGQNIRDTLPLFGFRAHFGGPGTIDQLWSTRFAKKHVVAALKFTAYKDKKLVLITHMGVQSKYRRNKLNTFLVESVQRKYPKFKVQFHDLTRDGRAFMEGSKLGEEFKTNPQDEDLRSLQREWKRTGSPVARGKLIRALRRAVER